MRKIMTYYCRALLKNVWMCGRNSVTIKKAGPSTTQMGQDTTWRAAVLSPPNLITLVRYALIPVLIWAAYEGELALFAAAFYVCGVSDYADGYVARRYGLATSFGSDLDNISDELLLVLSLLFMHLLRPEVIADNVPLFAGFLAAAAADRTLFYAKHRGKGRLHLYSGKTFQRAFYLGLPLILWIDAYRLVLYVVFGLGIITFAEQSALYLTRSRIDPEEKSFIPLRYNVFKYLYRH